MKSRPSRAVSGARGVEPHCKREKYWIVLENSSAGCLCWQSVSPWLRKGVRKYGNARQVPAAELIPSASQNTPRSMQPVRLSLASTQALFDLLQGSGHKSPLPSAIIYMEGKHIRTHLLQLPRTYSLFFLRLHEGNQPSSTQLSDLVRQNIGGVPTLACSSAPFAQGRECSAPSRCDCSLFVESVLLLAGVELFKAHSTCVRLGFTTISDKTYRKRMWLNLSHPLWRSPCN